MSIRLRHILVLLLVLFLCVSYSGDDSSDDDCSSSDSDCSTETGDYGDDTTDSDSDCDDSDCSGDDTSYDDDDCSDCSSEDTSTGSDGEDPNTFDCAACYSEPDYTSTTGTTGVPTSNVPPDVYMTNRFLNVSNGQAVSLIASAIDPNGDVLTCKWKQFTGLPWVVLTGDTTTNCTFIAPAIRTTLSFRFTASDGKEEDSLTCTVYVGYN